MYLRLVERSTTLYTRITDGQRVSIKRFLAHHILVHLHGSIQKWRSGKSGQKTTIGRPSEPMHAMPRPRKPKLPACPVSSVCPVCRSRRLCRGPCCAGQTLGRGYNLIKLTQNYGVRSWWSFGMQAVVLESEQYMALVHLFKSTSHLPKV